MADKPRRGVFTVSEFLESQGLELIGQDNNKIRVQNAEGDIGSFNPQAYLKAQGVNPAQVDIQINTPEQASNLSPVTVKQRAKLSLGNIEGGLKFLRQNFEDAKMHPEQGLIVKHNGVWAKVDPKGLGSGDAWDMAREFAKDASDWFGDALVIGGSVGGAAKGAAIGAPAGPAGAVAGGIAGSTLGAGSGEALRTSLGRVVGTYEATTEEQFKDVGFEAMLGLGGEGVALGAKLAVPQLVKAGVALKRSAGEQSKKLISETLGQTTGVGSKAMETFIDNSPEIGKQLRVLKKKAGAGGDVDTIAGDVQLKAAKQFLENANRELPRQYEVALNKVFDTAKARGVTVNVTKIIDDAMKNLESKGIGKIDKDTKMLRMLSPSEQAERARRGLDTELIDRQTFGQVRSIVNDLNGFSRVGTLKGAPAAKVLATLNKTLNKKFNDIARDPTKAQLRRIIASTNEGYRNGVNRTLADKGLAAEWNAAQSIYQRFADSVGTARRIMRSDEQINTFAGRLLQDSVTGRRAQGMASDLLQLTGTKGQKLYEDIIFTETARRFAPWVPKMGFASRIGAGGAGGLTVAGEVGLGTGGAILSQFSPRIVAAEVRAGVAMLDFIKTLPTPTRLQLLAEPRALQSMFLTWQSAKQREDQMLQQIMTQSGAAGGQQAQR